MPQINYRLLAMISMGISIVANGVAHHAPAMLPGLWLIQTLGDVCGASGLAALFMEPQIKAPAP